MDINKLLNDLEFEVACEMEMNNLDLSAKEDITYHYPIHLN